MPIEIIYLLILLAVIVAVFVIYKRPIYEAMFVGYAAMIAVTGKFNVFWEFLIKPSTDTLFYAIFAFMMLAFIFTETNVVDDIIRFILAIVGRFNGGAGYVSLTASTFMAALSGTGPGNVAATGVMTIPAMIRTGFPKALASTVEMSASSLGPMIPPSGTILLAFGTLTTLYPNKYELSNFWMVVWVIGVYFILQRFITLWLFCKRYKVKPMPKEEIPSLKQSWKQGWKALLVPIIIFVPLLLDFLLKDTFFTARLGAKGASALSSSVILFTPGVAAAYSFLISRKKLKTGADPVAIVNLFKKAVKTITPVAATIYFAYCISNLFGTLKIGESMGQMIQNLGFTKIGLAVFIPLFTAFLGMVLPGSSQIAIFGTGIVGSMAAMGLNPLLAAAILPAITGAMEGMTPPLALSMYAAMGISGSGFVETSKLALVWVFAHLAVSILLLMGLLPLFIL